MKIHSLGVSKQSGLDSRENISLERRGRLEKAMEARLRVLVGSVEPTMNNGNVLIMKNELKNRETGHRKLIRVLWEIV